MATNSYGTQVPVVMVGSGYSTHVDGFGNITSTPTQSSSSSSGSSSSGSSSNSSSSSSSNSHSSTSSSSSSSSSTLTLPAAPVAPTTSSTSLFTDDTMQQILDLIGVSDDDEDTSSIRTSEYIKPSGNISYLGY